MLDGEFVVETSDGPRNNIRNSLQSVGEASSGDAHVLSGVAEAIMENAAPLSFSADHDLAHFDGGFDLSQMQDFTWLDSLPVDLLPSDHTDFSGFVGFI